jgi:hypothetical protein
MSFYVNSGVPFDSLPPASYPPTGYSGDSPYWDFGATRVMNLRDASGTAGVGRGSTYLAGYSGGSPWTAGSNVRPSPPLGTIAPNGYTIPSVARSPFDTNPSDGDMLFEINDFLSPSPARIAMTPAVQSSDAIVEGSVVQASTAPSGGGASWGLLLVVAVIVWAIFAED